MSLAVVFWMVWAIASNASGATEPNQDASQVAHFRNVGADLSKPMTIDFAMHVESEESAHRVAARLPDLGSFMSAFPDLKISMDLVVDKGKTEYHWTLTGTHTGPGGTDMFVRISGFEEWRFGAGGLIAESLGHFDAADYQRQLNAGGHL